MADLPKFVRVAVLEHGLMLNCDVLLAPGHLIEIEDDIAAELIAGGKAAAAAHDDRMPVRLVATEAQ